MAYFPMIVGVAALVGLVVFFWKRNGPGSGLWFGHRLAAHVGIQRKVFFALVESGAKDSSRELLASLARRKPGLDDASVEIAPVLSRGIERLEARFGPQEMVDRAKPIVEGLVAAHERQRQEPRGAAPAGI